MTIWTPELADGPVYVAIADAIGRDLAAGVIEAGVRLPTHRELARRLGVTVGTVTRGYSEAERRGLVTGEVGRGTFVRGREEPEGFGWRSARRRDTATVVDMSLACPWDPPDGGDSRVLADTLRALAASDVSDLLLYDADSAAARHRRIAAEWIGGMGVPVEPERIVVTVGAQHALTVILSTMLRPGDTLLAAELTYPALKAVAQMLGIRLRGLEMDEEGIRPDAVERACREGSARALYCVPTLQNPTCRMMSLQRREAIVAAVRKHDLMLIEDAVHVPMTADETPQMASMTPERTLHLTTLSKWATFGLRTGFVVAPEPYVERIRSGVRSTCWMAPPLMVEIATRWLADGTAERLAERKRVELEIRHGWVREILGSKYNVESHPRSLHCWLHLPDPWRSDEFLAHARQRGVLVAGAEAFAVGRREVPHAVRLAIAASPSSDRVRHALQAVDEILEGRAEPVVDIL